MEMNQEFNEKAQLLLSKCFEAGYEMRQFYLLRHPVAQGKLWRQSRSLGEINRMVEKLREQGADFLADCILTAGPQHGRLATNAIPGFSWHQYGEAMDCFWIMDGQAVWEVKNGDDNGYRVYARIAEEIGLTSLWSVGDWCHVQLRARNPSGLFSVTEIDRKMREVWGMYAFEGAGSRLS